MAVWIYLDSKVRTGAAQATESRKRTFLPGVRLSQGFGGEEDAMRKSSRFGSLLLVES